MRLALAIFFLMAALARAETWPPVTVFAPPVCLACLEWAEHLRQQGFAVSVVTSEDLAKVRQRQRVPAALEVRHVAVVGGYFVAGHVPAEDIKQLLQEKPRARGLVVPGAPRGAPGLDILQGTGCETGCTMLEAEGAANRVRREMFDTLLVLPDGSTRIWARH
ncbi:MAG: metal-binding protein [Rhodocyclaceae bacterium]|nr:metal-binding protein [Rhodocyclaceae bacterium]